jgi:hypothetical protein
LTNHDDRRREKGLDGMENLGHPSTCFPRSSTHGPRTKRGRQSVQKGENDASVTSLPPAGRLWLPASEGRRRSPV